MIETKYFVFPAGKPEEKFEVLPHTAGDQNADGFSDFGFVDAKLASTDAWFTPEVKYVWDNGAQDGSFVNNDIEQLDQTGQFDIVKEEVEVADEPAVETPDSEVAA